MMTKKLSSILSVCSLLLIAACASKPAVPQGEFQIKGEVSNIPDSTVIILYSSGIDGWKLVATDTIMNGKFIFQDTITTDPRKLELMWDDGTPQDYTAVWVASGEQTSVAGINNLLLEWNVTSKLAEQEEENKYKALTIAERKALISLCIPEQEIIFDIFNTHGGDREYAKANWPKIDSLRNLQDPIRESIDSLEINYMKTAPINRVWMHKLHGIAFNLRYKGEYKFTPQVMELYARMSDSDKENGMGKYIDEYINLKEVNIGDNMVDADLYDIQGQKHRLSEYKGKYILIDFWSAGCGPCRQSIPEIEEVTETHKENLVVIGISIDGKNDWINYIKESGIKGLQWNELRADENGIDAKYQSRGIPHYVMISPEGKVIDMWTGYGPGSIKEKIKTLVK